MAITLILFKWLVAGILPVAWLNPAHPFYMSVTQIEHNASEKILEVSCKIFTDDFEKTLRQHYKTNVDLLRPKDKTAMNKLVSGYVLTHLSIQVNGKPAALQFMGYEEEGEGIVSYYQANNIAAVKKITVTNNILYDYKSEQVSLLHVIVNDNRKSTKLNNPEENASFDF